MAGLPVPGVSPLSRRSSNITRDVQAPAHANVVGACVASFVLFVIMVGAWLIFTKTRRKMKTCRVRTVPALSIGSLFLNFMA